MIRSTFIRAAFTVVLTTVAASSAGAQSAGGPVPPIRDTSVHVGIGYGAGLGTRSSNSTSSHSGVGEGAGRGMTVDEQLQMLSDTLALTAQQRTEVRAILEDERERVTRILGAHFPADEQRARILDEGADAASAIRGRLSGSQRRVFDRMPLDRLGLGASPTRRGGQRETR